MLLSLAGKYKIVALCGNGEEKFWFVALGLYVDFKVSVWYQAFPYKCMSE